MQKTRLDIHQTITDSLIAQIESSPGEWQMPWARPGFVLEIPQNVTGRSYNGINIVSLWCAAMSRGYPRHLWGTYRQWAERGAQVRAGEKASLVVFYKDLAIETENAETGETEQETRHFAKASWAFNVAQVDNWKLSDSDPAPDLTERIEAANRFVAATGARIEHGHAFACYRPGPDLIAMPDRSAFTGTATSTPTEAYYGTLLHELTHFSAIEGRCNRDLGKRFGDDRYAVEELVAELGSAFLCAELGIAATPRADHAQYLAHWLRVLRADSRALFAAAAAASKAVAFLRGAKAGSEAG